MSCNNKDLDFIKLTALPPIVEPNKAYLIKESGATFTMYMTDKDCKVYGLDPSAYTLDFNEETNILRLRNSGGVVSQVDLSSLAQAEGVVSVDVQGVTINFRDSAGDVIDSIQLGVSNIVGLQDELDEKEDLVNKVTDLSSPNNLEYPTTQAVYDAIQGFVPDLTDYVSYNPQSKSESQKQQARINIGVYSTQEIQDFLDGSTPINGYNKTNWDTAYSWGDWSTGVNKAYIDLLNVDAGTLDGLDSTDFVTITGVQSITGQKSFTTGITLPNTTNIGGTITNSTRIPVIGTDGLVNSYTELEDLFALNPPPPTPNLQEVAEEGNRTTETIAVDATNATFPNNVELRATGESALIFNNPFGEYSITPSEETGDGSFNFYTPISTGSSSTSKFELLIADNSNNLDTHVATFLGRVKGVDATDPDDYPTYGQLLNDLAAYIPLTEKGAINGVATLDSSGVIPQTQLPALAITDTFPVDSEAEMLALNAQTGDVAVRRDISKTFILQGTDPSSLTEWQELLSPTDSVQSVNGLQGVVQLDLSFGAGQLSITGGNTVNLDSRYSLSSHTHNTLSPGNGFTGNTYTPGNGIDRIWGIDPNYTGFNNYYTQSQSDVNFLNQTNNFEKADGYLLFEDGVSLRFGNNGDFRILHAPDTHTYFQMFNEGNLIIRDNDNSVNRFIFERTTGNFRTFSTGYFGSSTSRPLVLESSAGARGIQLNQGGWRGSIDWHPDRYLIRNSSDDVLFSINWADGVTNLSGALNIQGNTAYHSGNHRSDSQNDARYAIMNDVTQNSGQLTIRTGNSNTTGLRLLNNSTGQSSFLYMDNSNDLNINNSSASSRPVYINKGGNGSLIVGGGVNAGIGVLQNNADEILNLPSVAGGVMFNMQNSSGSDFATAYGSAFGIRGSNNERTFFLYKPNGGSQDFYISDYGNNSSWRHSLLYHSSNHRSDSQNDARYYTKSQSDNNYVKTNARTDTGYAWIRYDTTGSVLYVTNQGTGDIARFYSGSGDGSVQTVIKNNGSVYMPSGGDIQMYNTGGIQRFSYNSGHLIGAHNTLGNSQDATNPIFTIGGNYNPFAYSLNNMYGIGYAQGSAASYLNATDLGTNPSNGWGLYVAAVGRAGIFLDASNGNGYFKGNVYAQVGNFRGQVNASGGNSVQWNAAYGWGNHASAGYVPTSRTISAGSGLTGGGNLSSNRTLSVDSTVARTNVAETFSSTVTATNFILSSDRRLKENIESLGNGYYTFNFKDDKTKRKRYGAMADEVKEYAPELIYKNEEGYEQVGYIDFLIKKIAELENKINSL